MINARSTSTWGSLIFGLSLVGGALCQAETSDHTPHAVDLTQSYSAPALYNLGNSYAREGKPALAMLNYERARVLAPQDSDIRANSQHERELASLPSSSTGFDARIRLMSPNATYWLGLMGLVMAGISSLLFVVKKFPRVFSGGAFGVALLMVAYTASDAVATAHLMREAVVMQSTSASASPIANAESLFTLSPATLVHIQDAHGNFLLIRDPQGNVGWVPRSDLTRVINSSGDIHA